MGCDYQSRAILRVQAEQQLLHLFAYAVIEGAGGLVSQNQFRLQDHGAGDRNPLLLPAREFAGAMCHAIFEPDFGEQPQRLRFGAGRVHPVDQRREHHVFQGREVRQQVVELKNKSDHPVAKFR